MRGQVVCGKGVKSVCMIEAALKRVFKEQYTVSRSHELLEGISWATEALGLDDLSRNMDSVVDGEIGIEDL